MSGDLRSLSDIDLWKMSKSPYVGAETRLRAAAILFGRADRRRAAPRGPKAE